MQNYNKRDVIFGAAACIFGIAMIASAWKLENGFSYDGVGPRVLPIIVSAGIAISGVFMAISALRREEKEELVQINWLPAAIVSSGILFMYFFILTLGWIVSATVLFFMVAMAFKSRRQIATLLIGFISSTATFVIFNYLMGIRLPIGSLFSFLT